ncbi:MAG TPA: hypothetical protein VFJ12_04150, partial [Segeticoccus sp.]|nr:hypothetical protein [Segeticoccus sp.]
MTPRLPLGRSSSPDDDPTGVRALLSSLPEPGPMPAELVERITSSLAEEQRARGSADAGADGAHPGYLPETEADVRPLVRRPRWRQVVGGATGAAAAVVVGFVAVNAYTQSGGSSASSASGGSVARSSISGGSAGSTAGPESDASGGRGAPQHAEGLADAGALGAVRITQSGRNYTEDGFARQAVPLAHG